MLRLHSQRHPSPFRLDFRFIAAQAVSCADTLVPQWLPDGRRRGAEWVALNPTRPDRCAGSFSVNLRTGRWADFATGDGGGDLISLRAYLDNLSQGEAARRIALELDLP
jgi:putative DNA primase/helicase